MRDTGVSRTSTDEFVEFWPAGKKVNGEFHCSDCGYGIAIVRVLPVCPMCGGTSWEESPWSPFTRSKALL